MTARERVLAVFRYQAPDRTCFDLLEGTVWDRLGYFFHQHYGCKQTEDVLNLLDCDFRWSHLFEVDSPLAETENVWVSPKSYADVLGDYPLAGVTSVAEVDRIFNPDPAERPMPDFKRMRELYPDKALIFAVPWTPIFSGACGVFGMEEAMVKMAIEPEIFKAFAIKQSEYLIGYLRLALKAGVNKYCDFFWTGDDFAHGSAMMLSPDSWRKLIRPYLEPSIRLAKDSGMHTLFHSCGAVSEVYGDFIDMGVDGHNGVQTSAAGMDIHSLAKNFGGKIVIFGGVDAQTTLVSGTVKDVDRQVKENIAAFEKCGGYIVCNSHHGLPDIKGENIVAMAKGAGREVSLSASFQRFPG